MGAVDPDPPAPIRALVMGAVDPDPPAPVCDREGIDMTDEEVERRVKAMPSPRLAPLNYAVPVRRHKHTSEREREGEREVDADVDGEGEVYYSASEREGECLEGLESIGMGDVLDTSPVVSARLSNRQVVIGEKVLTDYASHDYLGMSMHPVVLKKARAALRRYGVGSCGPRSFYGTMDAHLLLEQSLAKWTGAEQCIAYSFGQSAMGSVVPCFARPGDILFVDELCTKEIFSACTLSRATVMIFRHNDMESLEALMHRVSVSPKDRKDQRRFVIVEGLYKATGNVCPIHKVIPLAESHFCRVILDESHSLGVLGHTGRGVLEHWRDRDVSTYTISDVDLVTAGLEAAVGGMGGVCLGDTALVEHQRLNGIAYCFSASCPPYLAVAATSSVGVLTEDTSLVLSLGAKCRSCHTLLADMQCVNRGDLSGLGLGVTLLTQFSGSPIQVLSLPSLEACLSVQSDMRDKGYLLGVDRERANLRMCVGIGVGERDRQRMVAELDAVIAETLA
ncbi:hypothetical protein KIPB_007485 [Kipferlia bialata]|uniref:serine C-palmitoyltransferase n=1 Tax=Kipferlia bialata TaxID=797122 RepID=A0A9K3D1T6_9EUKA|nr:hypothetical protein KIPB_007485 [Kipferlia bialata]|eukprot:g7485.t1